MCLFFDGNDLIWSDGDTQANLHQHLKRKRLKMWSDGKAECLSQLLGQSTEFSGILTRVVSIRSTAAIAHKEQLSPAYYVIFADVVCCSVHTQAVNTVKWSAVDWRLHTKISPQ